MSQSRTLMRVTVFSPTGAPPAASVSLRVKSFEERGEGDFSYVSMTADQDASAGGGVGGGSAYRYMLLCIAGNGVPVVKLTLVVKGIERSLDSVVLYQ